MILTDNDYSILFMQFLLKEEKTETNKQTNKQTNSRREEENQKQSKEKRKKLREKEIYTERKERITNKQINKTKQYLFIELK